MAALKIRRQAIRACLGGLLAWLSMSVLSTASADDSRWSKARERGTLTVAVYNDFAPFHQAGQGIDVDLAAALARRVGLKSHLMPFDADEELSDDLRNMVWKGHYLGFGPADLMLHVPVDQRLMQANEQVQVFGPYHRENVALGWRLDRFERLTSLEPFVEEPIAVDGTSIAALIMAGTDRGRYRDSIKVFRSPQQAIEALTSGRVPAAMALRSELEAQLQGDARFAIGPVPSTRAPAQGWVVGMAVKAGETDMAKALQQALNAMIADGELDRLFKAHGVRRVNP